MKWKFNCAIHDKAHSRRENVHTTCTITAHEWLQRDLTHLWEACETLQSCFTVSSKSVQKLDSVWVLRSDHVSISGQAVTVAKNVKESCSWGQNKKLPFHLNFCTDGCWKWKCTRGSAHICGFCSPNLHVSEHKHQQNLFKWSPKNANCWAKAGQTQFGTSESAPEEVLTSVDFIHQISMCLSTNTNKICSNEAQKMQIVGQRQGKHSSEHQSQHPSVWAEWHQVDTQNQTNVIQEHGKGLLTKTHWVTEKQCLSSAWGKWGKIDAVSFHLELKQKWTFVLVNSSESHKQHKKSLEQIPLSTATTGNAELSWDFFVTWKRDCVHFDGFKAHDQMFCDEPFSSSTNELITSEPQRCFKMKCQSCESLVMPLWENAASWWIHWKCHCHDVLTNHPLSAIHGQNDPMLLIFDDALMECDFHWQLVDGGHKFKGVLTEGGQFNLCTRLKHLQSGWFHWHDSCFQQGRPLDALGFKMIGHVSGQKHDELRVS